MHQSKLQLPAEFRRQLLDVADRAEFVVAAHRTFATADAGAAERTTVLLSTCIYLQNLASMQPRTSLVKFARSPCADPPGVNIVATVGKFC